MTFAFKIVSCRVWTVRLLLTILSAFALILVSGCSPTSRTPFASVQRPIFYVPMQQDHKTVYGMLIYSGDRSLADTPFAPWNIKATEICFETVPYGADSLPSETCQKLQRYNREGSPPDTSDVKRYDKMSHDESFFAILVDGHAKTLRLMSIVLHGKEYSYILKFSSPPSGALPETDFVNFGYLGVTGELKPGQKDPQLSLYGIIMYPFQNGIKASKAGCAAVKYDIPFTIERVPLRKAELKQ